MIIGGKSFVFQTWLGFNDTIYEGIMNWIYRGLTSPLMYEKIAARKSVSQLYEEKLVVSNFFSLVS